MTNQRNCGAARPPGSIPLEAKTGEPYLFRLPDGRMLFVEVPSRMTDRDRGGELVFTLEGVRFLDRVRALAMRAPASPSPAYLATLREALGMTQQELGRRIGRSKLTISRWERGTLRPSREALGRFYALAAGLKRRGIDLGLTG